MAEVVAIQDLLPDDVVSFTTYGNTIIPNVQNGTILAIQNGIGLINPTAAAANAANIYPAIPQAEGQVLSRNFLSYKYLRIQLPNNTVVEIAEPWINPVSVHRLVRKTATLIIRDFDPSHTQRVVNLLAEHGYLSTQITIN